MEGMTLPDVTLGREPYELTTTALGYGAMSLAGAYGPISEEAAIALLHDVYDRGVTFLDTANIYGLGVSETILGTFLRGRRHEFMVATKAGIDPSGEAGKRRQNGKPEHLREQIVVVRARPAVQHEQPRRALRPVGRPIERDSRRAGETLSAWRRNGRHPRKLNA